MEYWLNAKPDDPVAFAAQVTGVCEVYQQAPALAEQGGHVISTDEKTGIQALERAKFDAFFMADHMAVLNMPMDALKRSLANERQAPPPAAKGKKAKKRVEGQREMLLPISGKRAAKEEAKAESKSPAEKNRRAVRLGQRR